MGHNVRATTHSPPYRLTQQQDSPPSVWLLARLARALRILPDTPTGFEQPPPSEQAVGWLQRDNGVWSPVYSDGLVGPEFSWTQMLAATGEDLGDVIESVIEAGLIETHARRDRRRCATDFHRTQPDLPS